MSPLKTLFAFVYGLGSGDVVGEDGECSDIEASMGVESLGYVTMMCILYTEEGGGGWKERSSGGCDCRQDLALFTTTRVTYLIVSSFIIV